MVPELGSRGFRKQKGAKCFNEVKLSFTRLCKTDFLGLDGRGPSLRSEKERVKNGPLRLTEKGSFDLHSVSASSQRDLCWG